MNARTLARTFVALAIFGSGVALADEASTCPPKAKITGDVGKGQPGIDAYGRPNQIGAIDEDQAGRVDPGAIDRARDTDQSVESSTPQGSSGLAPPSDCDADAPNAAP